MLRFLLVSALWSVSLLAWQPAQGQSPPTPVNSETVELVGHKVTFEEFACPSEGGAGNTSIDVSLDDRFLGTLDFCLEPGSTVQVVIVSGGEEFDGGGWIGMNEHRYPPYYPEAYVIIVFYGWYEDGRRPCAYIDLRYRSNAAWAHPYVPDWDPLTVDPEADAAKVRSIFADLATKDPYYGMASFYGRKGVEVKPLLFSEGVLIVTGVSLDAYDEVQPDGSTVRDPCAAPEGGWGGRNPNGNGNPGQPGCCSGGNSGGNGGDADPACSNCHGGNGGNACGQGRGGNGGNGAGCGNGGKGGDGGKDGGSGGAGGNSGANCGYGGNGGHGGGLGCNDNPDHEGGNGGDGGNGVQGGGIGGRGGDGHPNGGHGGNGGHGTGPSGQGGRGGCGGSACSSGGNGGNGGTGGNSRGGNCGGKGGCPGRAQAPGSGADGHRGNPGQPGPGTTDCKPPPPPPPPRKPDTVSQGELQGVPLWW